jgi:glycosyltransferase involved in cell wall biosynthesis
MISIITPVLNGSEFISKNIESIRKLQITYEHIVVDGGSTDSTLEKLQNYPNIQIVHQKEQTGMYEAIHLGIEKAKGDYVCWINCDDQIVLPGFQMLVNFAEENNLDIACSNGIFHYTGENYDKLVRGTRAAKYFLKKGLFPFSQPSVVFSKTVYFDIGGFDYTNFKIGGDGDLFRRIAGKKNSRIGFIDVTSSIFLKHGNSLGDRNTPLYLQESLQSKQPVASLLNRGFMKLARMVHF